MEELQATQEEMQRANKEREARERIIDSTNMMLETDDEFKIVNINNKVGSLLRYEMNDLNGKTLDQIVESAGDFQTMKNSLQNGETWTGTIRLKGKYKEVIQVKISAGKVADGSSSKYLLIATDVEATTA